MVDCPNKQENLEKCNCSYPGCSRKGICCECLHYHREMGELPACLFSDEAEKTHDRSVNKFIKDKS